MNQSKTALQAEIDRARVHFSGPFVRLPDQKFTQREEYNVNWVKGAKRDKGQRDYQPNNLLDLVKPD